MKVDHRGPLAVVAMRSISSRTVTPALAAIFQRRTSLALISSTLISAANLENADLDGINFVNADLSSASLDGMSMKGAELIDVNLHGANLTGADLDYDNIDGSNLSLVDLTNARLAHSTFVESSLRQSYLTAADLRFAFMPDEMMAGSNLAYANFKGADLEGADIQGAVISKGAFGGADTHNANMNGTVVIKIPRYCYSPPVQSGTTSGKGIPLIPGGGEPGFNALLIRGTKEVTHELGRLRATTLLAAQDPKPNELGTR